MFKKNIIVINCHYMLTVFHKLPMKYHVNVTKIKNLGDVDEAIRFVRQNYFNRKEFQMIKQCIDNITATCNLKKSIQLEKLAISNRNTRYNPERFPGVRIKIPEINGTAIVFASGGVNILGCKSYKEVTTLWKAIISLV